MDLVFQRGPESNCGPRGSKGWSKGLFKEGFCGVPGEKCDTGGTLKGLFKNLKIRLSAAKIGPYVCHGCAPTLCTRKPAGS